MRAVRSSSGNLVMSGHKLDGLEAVRRSLDDLLSSLSAVVEGGTKYGNFPPGMTNDMLCEVEERLDLATSHLRTMRNSRTPICTLPPELLNEIFKMTQAPLPHFMPGSVRNKFDSTHAARDNWHPSLVAGVCRYWRAVTLSFPSIWTTIDIGDPIYAQNANIDLAMLCLRRSYAADVDLHLWSDLPESAMPWFTETLASQSIRFRGFHIYNFKSGTRLLDIFTECPAPQLEALTIQTWPQEGASRPLQLPVMFAGITPYLRRLTLRHYNSWPGNNFSKLTHLCLEHQVNERTSLRRTSEFLQLLASCPDLEELIVNRAGPNDSELIDSRTPETRVSLPRLRKVVFKRCPVPCVARILCHIQISERATVQLLHCQKGSPATLLSALAGCANLGRVSRVKLECQIPSWELDEMMAFPEIPRCLRLTGSGESSFDIFPGADLHEVATNQYMAALVGVLAACRIEELWLGADEVVAREALWQRIFFAMPMLGTLYIGPRLAGLAHSYPCVSALHIADEALGLALPCPHLSGIKFLGMSVDGTRLFLPAIRRLLRERKRRGFPVSSVTIISTPDGNGHKLAGEHLRDDLANFRCIVGIVEVVNMIHFPVMDGLRCIREFGDKLR